MSGGANNVNFVGLQLNEGIVSNINTEGNSSSSNNNSNISNIVHHISNISNNNNNNNNNSESGGRIGGITQQNLFTALVQFMQASLEARFTEEEKILRERLEVIEKQRRRVFQLIENKEWANALFTLNVGGTIFTTTRRTLCAVPESMLTFLTMESLNIERDIFGAIFLDRSPQLFSEILSYLRLKAEDCRVGSDSIHTLKETTEENDEKNIISHLIQKNWFYMNSIQLHALAEEANYYNLKNLENHLISYCKRRWIEYGTFIISHEENNIMNTYKNTNITKNSLNTIFTSNSITGDSVLCIAYDEESKICAVGRGSGIVTVYFLPSLTRLETLYGHTDCVTSVIVTPKNIFSSSRDGCIRIWHNRENNFAPICSLQPHNGFIHNLLLLPDKLTLLSCGGDNIISVCNIRHGCQVIIERVINAPDPIRCLALYHRYVFASCREKILILDLTKGNLLPQEGKAHLAPIRSLAVNEHTGLLASGGWDGVLYIWNAKEITEGILYKTQNNNSNNNSNNNCFMPLYAVAQCDSWVTHVSFVGDLLAASCGSTINFFDCGLLPRVVRFIKKTNNNYKTNNNTSDELVRVFLAIESVNCLLVGGINGTLTVLHSRMFAEKTEDMEKPCQ